jgi:hypothetical protein
VAGPGANILSKNVKGDNARKPTIRGMEGLMADNSLGSHLAQAVKDVRALAGATARAAKAELAKGGGRFAAGLAWFACALVAILGLPPLLILAFVWGLVALGIWPWAAYLIAAGVVMLAAVALILIGRRAFKRGAQAVSRATAVVGASFDALTGHTHAGATDTSPAAAPVVPPAAAATTDPASFRATDPASFPLPLPPNPSPTDSDSGGAR